MKCFQHVDSLIKKSLTFDVLGIKEADAMQAAVVASWLQVVLGVEGCWGNPLKGMRIAKHDASRSWKPESHSQGLFFWEQAIVSLESLEHPESKEKCPVPKLLNKGGTLELQVPNVQSPWPGDFWIYFAGNHQTGGCCSVPGLITGTTKCYGAMGCHCKMGKFTGTSYYYWYYW